MRDNYRIEVIGGNYGSTYKVCRICGARMCIDVGSSDMLMHQPDCSVLKDETDDILLLLASSQDIYDLETAILHHRERFPRGVVKILEKLTRQRREIRRGKNQNV